MTVSSLRNFSLAPSRGPQSANLIVVDQGAPERLDQRITACGQTKKTLAGARVLRRLRVDVRCTLEMIDNLRPRQVARWLTVAVEPDFSVFRSTKYLRSEADWPENRFDGAKEPHVGDIETKTSSFRILQTDRSRHYVLKSGRVPGKCWVNLFASPAFLLVFLAASWLAFPVPSCADTPSSRAGPALLVRSLADPPAPSLAEIRTKAEQGDAAAQYTLGMRYVKGQDVAQDDTEAARWLRKAAQQGDANAQVAFGMAYYHGYGVRQDYAEAVTWLRKAAEQGNAKGQILIAWTYEKGLGVTQNHIEAARWLRKAAEQGDASAQLTLGSMYYEGHDVTQDYAEAARWLRKAAEQGDADAQYDLGLLYAEGKGVARNYTEPYMWFSSFLANNNGPLGFIHRLLARVSCYIINYFLPADQIADSQKRAGTIVKDISLLLNPQSVTLVP